MLLLNSIKNSYLISALSDLAFFVEHKTPAESINLVTE